jgi:molybdate transport system ATP-binding protein
MGDQRPTERGVIELALRLARAGPPAFELCVDVKLPSRGVSALFGPSGCGKTTLLRALAGLERAVGRVSVDGEVWQDDARQVFVPPHRRPLGYVIQEAALFPHLDVGGNLEYGRRRTARPLDVAALHELVQLLGIEPLLSRSVSTLSGGERQRVAIARALATAPRLLLMDEPLAALDAPRKAEILPYLERLHRHLALPIVYVTHAMDEVARLADHLVLMAQGRVQASGELAALMSRPDLPLPRRDDAGVVLNAVVARRDAAYGLMWLAFGGHGLWVADGGQPLGEPVRARVSARDVSVSRREPQDSSIINVLPCRLEAMHGEAHTVLLQLAVGDSESGSALLLARITRRSVDQLGLCTGDALFAQVKGVALM